MPQPHPLPKSPHADFSIHAEKSASFCYVGESTPVGQRQRFSKSGVACTVIHGDSRMELAAYINQVDLIVTSPPYADARRNHYDSIHPDKFTDWFLTFHDTFFNSLKPTGSLVINIKDKVVEGARQLELSNLP